MKVKTSNTVRGLRNRYNLVRFLIFAAALVLAIAMLNQPQRTAVNYCKAYTKEQDKLSASNGSRYNTKIFSHASSQPQDFVDAFGELGKVAPTDIEPDVRALQNVFQSIRSRPDQTLSISISGLQSETNVANWTRQHCGK